MHALRQYGQMIDERLLPHVAPIHWNRNNTIIDVSSIDPLLPAVIRFGLLSQADDVSICVSY